MAEKEYANAYKGKKYITPGGRTDKRYGPHKKSLNRAEMDKLLPFVPKGIREKIIKFADEFDAKQYDKSDLRRATKKMKERAKKLTAYKGYT